MRIPLAVLLALGGCATGKVASPPPPAAAPAPEPDTMPADFQEHLRDAEQIGVSLYRNDKVSAIGTDVLLEHLGSLDGKGLGGYLTIQEGSDSGEPLDSWLVQFFGREEQPRVRYRIRIARGKKPAFEAVDPPSPASDSESALIRARRTAMAHLMRVDPPRQPINPVILPGQVLREKGILVYLLAGTTRPGVAVMGKHHRVLVSEDGTQVLRFEPMTKSIVEIEFGRPKADEKPAAILVSHILTEWPLETHVFTSLLHKQPVYVACSRHLWKVDGTRITLLPQPRHDQSGANRARAPAAPGRAL
jgi:hypothetical protein